ncbi:hypothetical protein [Methylomonas sp. HYX-M1]|uniref:hypothetical protein n=1 Tax=Methylomonas sp. HYX-M1 TaxID=3139307 RepID=UPI00345B4E54
MKFTVLINQFGIVKSGLHESTDLTDWAVIDYIKWLSDKGDVRADGFVLFEYRVFIEDMPMSGLNSNGGLSKRVHKLRGLKLIEVTKDDGGYLYAKLTDYCRHIISMKPDADDLQKERDAIDSFHGFVENNAEALGLLWRWGDGDGGYVFNRMKQHLSETGYIKDDGKRR